MSSRFGWDESLHAHLDCATTINLTPIGRSADSYLPPPKEIEEAIAGVNTRLRELSSQPE